MGHALKGGQASNQANVCGIRAGAGSSTDISKARPAAAAVAMSLRVTSSHRRQPWLLSWRDRWIQSHNGTCPSPPGQRQTATSSAVAAVRGAGHRLGAPTLWPITASDRLQALRRRAVFGRGSSRRVARDDPGDGHRHPGRRSTPGSRHIPDGGRNPRASGAGRIAAAGAAVPFSAQDVQIGSTHPARANEQGR